MGHSGCTSDSPIEEKETLLFQCSTTRGQDGFIITVRLLLPERIDLCIQKHPLINNKYGTNLSVWEVYKPEEG